VRYYEITIDGDEFDRGEDFCPFIVELDPKKYNYDFLLGQAKFISEWDPNISFYQCQDGEIATKLANDVAWLLFSDQAVVLFQKNNIQGFQYLPVQIFMQGGRKLNGYNSTANVCNAIECVDKERSVYTLFGDERPDKKGGIRDLEKIFLCRHKIPKELDIFRLKEQKTYIVVSERFFDIYKTHKYTGLSFNELEVSND
jgi:hypothetical protein